MQLKSNIVMTGYSAQKDQFIPYKNSGNIWYCVSVGTMVNTNESAKYCSTLIHTIGGISRMRILHRIH